MDRKTFDKIRAVVYERSGISLGPNKEALVSARIGKRMRALGLTEAEDYLNHLEGDTTGVEIVHLIDAISTNVTSFFREARHFALLGELYSKWRREGQRRFRFWSAAASSGEEPYSMAITLLENMNGQGCDARILATDISTRMLEQCRVGTYPEQKLKTVPVDLRNRYFDRTRTEDGVVYGAKRSLRDLVLFRRLNLSNPPFPMRGSLDVIFCRNVMIYFDNSLRARLLQELHRLLKPGGYLIVGHAESLTGIMGDFRSVEPSVYVK